VDFAPKVRIQMVVDDDMVQPIVEASQATACTGEIGNGKVFVSSVVDAIRTGTFWSFGVATANRAKLRKQFAFR
jgi:nitrogen regulatory protein P-II 1